jgi:hypothetical protein
MFHPYRSAPNPAPFVSDVLLFDRLVIPVPPADGSDDKFWEKFDPEQLRACLKILGVKTDTQDGLALTVPWDDAKHKRFDTRMSHASALATQHRSPEQTYYNDPFQMTRQLIKDEFLPALPKGASKAWTVAAYRSSNAYRRELAKADPNRQRRVAALMSHRFLTPSEPDPKHEILKRAVDLTTSKGFRDKRAAFYEWQEGIIEQEIADDKAVEEMEGLLKQYNDATRKAFKNVLLKYAFTVIPIGLGMTGAVIGGSTTGLILAGSGGLVSVAKYWTFDRKPVIEAGDLDAAAMIHDARKKLPLQ